METLNVTWLFATSIDIKQKRIGPPGSEQGLSMTRPSLYYALFTLEENPPTFPASYPIFLGKFFNMWITKTYYKSISLRFSCSKPHTEVKPAIPSNFANLATPMHSRVFMRALPTRSSIKNSHGCFKWRLLPTFIHV